jgi:hypothetical protein
MQTNRSAGLAESERYVSRKAPGQAWDTDFSVLEFEAWDLKICRNFARADIRCRNAEGV